MINDLHLDGSYNINTGLRLARKLLLDLTQLGLPTATELLDPIIPQYIADVISWTTSAHVPRKARTAAKWLLDCLCRLVSRTIQTAASTQRRTRCCPSDPSRDRN